MQQAGRKHHGDDDGLGQAKAALAAMNRHKVHYNKDFKKGGKKKKATPHVVIIRNVETDLAAIYSDALARFVMPRTEGARKDKQGSATERSVIATPDITVRTETRTAHIVFTPEMFSKIGEGATPFTTAEVVEHAKTRKVFGEPVTVASTDAAYQNDLVTASASTSTPVGSKQLRKLLADVPGFVSCWKLHASHFRVVFATSAALFAAKVLLDEFEAEGVRIVLQLSDGQADKYGGYVEERANAEM
jgi:hypothetical protein